MTHGYHSAEGRHWYPSAEAEFNLYNFHSQQQVDQLFDILASKNNDTPHVIELFGEQASGRYYLLRSAAHQASQSGTRVDVEELSLDGYEPDAPLKRLLQFLSSRASGEAARKLSDLGHQTKVEVRISPLTFLFATLGVKADLSVGEILQFLQSDHHTAGPRMSQPEALRFFLNQQTQRRRLVLHLSNGHSVDTCLILRLIDEAEVNSRFFVSLGYPPGTSGAPQSHREHFKLFIPTWTSGEMRRSFAERFRPNVVPSDFLDFAWASGGPVHSRQTFAQIVLRLVSNGWLAPDRKGIWRIEHEWRKNRSLVEEFGDLIEPVLQVRSHLEASGTPENEIKNLVDFLDAASLCDPTIPVKPLLRIVGVAAEKTDEFIDWIDALLRVDHEDGILEDVGFQHPGFPPSLLLYRFRNPLLPQAILRRHPNPNALALKVFNVLSSSLRPDTRALASLYLRLAESAGIDHETGQYGKLLNYWSCLNETEMLMQAIGIELERHNISPQLLWSIIRATEHSWAPARRLALIEAYGRQSGGVPLGNRFHYLFVLGETLFKLGRYAEAIDAAEVAIYVLLGNSELILGHWSKAEEWLQSAAATATSNFPPDHPTVATTLNNLALLRVRQGNYIDAEPMMQRALTIREKALGANHPDVAASLVNLGALYEHQGKLWQAEPLLQQALTIEETVLGPNHPEVASTLKALGSLYTAQGKYAEAEPLLQRALTIREKVLGPDHHGVAISIAALASLYDRQDKYLEAEPLFRRALAISEKMLGPDHPDVVATLNNLGILYGKQGKYTEAEPLLQRALAIPEPDHLHLAKSLNNLGILYGKQGKYTEAEPLLQRALAIRDEALDPDHPDVIQSVHMLAEVYGKQGKYTEAGPLNQRVLAIHNGITSLCTLAAFQLAQEKYADAESLYHRALRMCAELPTEYPIVQLVRLSYGAYIRKTAPPE